MWWNAGLKHGKVLVPYIVSYFHTIRFQVDHVWEIRGQVLPFQRTKRGLQERQPGLRVTTIEAICVSDSSNHLSNYCPWSLCLLLWQNASLKHGKVLVLYVVTHFHDIIFQVDHVWTIRGPSFANLKDKGGLKERWPGSQGYHQKAICVSASSYHLSKSSL